jgi:glycosyltransferase involved in cell wall biosynthesis
MKVSIITISLNQGAYLEQALRSVIDQRQEGVEVEYVVVDAGSTDSSAEVLDRYRDDIDVLICEPDDGPSDGLNKGFGRTTGDILGFLNADDYLEPGALRRVVRFFESHPSHGAVIGQLRRIDGTGDRQQTQVIAPSPFTAQRYAEGRTLVLQQSTFFRQSSWAMTSGFSSNNRTCWDAELFSEMAVNGVQFGLIQSILATFRIHDSSISGSGRLKVQYLRDRAMILQRLGLDATPSLGRTLRTSLWRARPVARLRNVAATAADRAFAGGRLGENATDSR